GCETHSASYSPIKTAEASTVTGSRSFPSPTTLPLVSALASAPATAACSVFTPHAQRRFPRDIVCSARQEWTRERPQQLPEEAQREPLARGRKRCLRAPVRAKQALAAQIGSLKAARRRAPECRKPRSSSAKRKSLHRIGRLVPPWEAAKV